MAKLAVYFVVAVVVCQSASVFSRQINFDYSDYDQFGFGNGNGNNNNNNNVQPTPEPLPTTTTAAPQFRNCFENCPKTAQYNPVCGTNQLIYNNINALRCAQYCGLRIEVLHIGNCRPSGNILELNVINN